jgi:hypothetical protein
MLDAKKRLKVGRPEKNIDFLYPDWRDRLISLYIKGYNDSQIRHDFMPMSNDLWYRLVKTNKDFNTIVNRGKLFLCANEGKQISPKHQEKLVRRNKNRKYTYPDRPKEKIEASFRSLLRYHLKNKTGHTFDIVGYTSEQLMRHLEQKFTGIMDWGNYGNVWHIDHITPASWYKYERPTDPQFKECWSLDNLQPKLKYDNISKGNRYSDKALLVGMQYARS